MGGGAGPAASSRGSCEQDRTSGLPGPEARDLHVLPLWRPRPASPPEAGCPAGANQDSGLRLAALGPACRDPPARPQRSERRSPTPSCRRAGRARSEPQGVRLPLPPEGPRCLFSPCPKQPVPCPPCGQGWGADQGSAGQAPGGQASGGSPSASRPPAPPAQPLPRLVAPLARLGPTGPRLWPLLSLRCQSCEEGGRVEAGRPGHTASPGQQPGRGLGCSEGRMNCGEVLCGS